MNKKINKKSSRFVKSRSSYLRCYATVESTVASSLCSNQLSHSLFNTFPFDCCRVFQPTLALWTLVSSIVRTSRLASIRVDSIMSIPVRDEQ